MKSKICTEIPAYPTASLLLPPSLPPSLLPPLPTVLDWSCPPGPREWSPLPCGSP
jgi:hypothetical protein